MKLPSQPFEKLKLTVYGAAVSPPREDWLPCRRANGLFQPASVILVAFPYRFPIAGERNVSRYAALRDYHKAVLELLEKLAAELNQTCPGDYIPFCDNSPFPEKRLAAEAGLGVIGRNSLLLTREYGSYVFLGELATDLPFEPTGDGRIHTCENCGACVSSCPGNALGNGFRPERCAAALTQKKGALTPEEVAVILSAGLVWGCDRCQEVCPYNLSASDSPLRESFLPVDPVLTEENLPSLREIHPYGWRPPAVLLRNLRLLSGK